MSIKNMETLSSGDDTDFSLSEFPPKDGFDYLHWSSSFQASIIQVCCLEKNFKVTENLSNVSKCEFKDFFNLCIEYITEK